MILDHRQRSPQTGSRSGALSEYKDMNNQPQHPLIGAFLDYLRYEKHFSPHTLKGYAGDLEQFCRFLLGGAGPGERPAGSSGPGDRPARSFGLAHATGGGVAVAPAPPQLGQQLLTVSPNTVRGFLARLREQNYSRASSARKLATLRSFYKFLLRRGQVTVNPVQAVRTPKLEKRLRALHPYELPEVIAVPITSGYRPYLAWIANPDKP